MKVMPIRYTDDIPAMVRFYGVLGLELNTVSRAGGWVDLTAGGGMVGLHAASRTEQPRSSGHCEISFESEERLDDVAARLRGAGYTDAHVVDEAFGRSLRVTDPDGVPVQVNESDPSLYT